MIKSFLKRIYLHHRHPFLKQFWNFVAYKEWAFIRCSSISRCIFNTLRYLTFWRIAQKTICRLEGLELKLCGGEDSHFLVYERAYFAGTIYCSVLSEVTRRCQKLVYNFRRGDIKCIEWNIYENWAMCDAGKEGPPNIRQSISIFRGVHRSEFGMQEDGTYDKGSHAIRWDYCY